MSDFVYEVTKIDDKCCKITSISSSFGHSSLVNELRIPETFGDYKVVGITKQAGQELRYRIRINKLIIPKTVEFIEDNAFSYVDINELIFEKGSQIKLIANNAFAYTHIKKLDINSKQALIIGCDSFYDTCIETLDLIKCTNIRSFGKNCFSSSHIKNVKLPSNIETLADEMFKDNDITDISFLLKLDKCSVIPEGCFADCYITKIPDEVFKKYCIEDYAFEDNEFETLNLPRYAKLGSSVFKSNDKLRSVTTNILFIPDYLFFSCRNLEKVIIKHAIEISTSAFRACSINELTFEDDNLQFIGSAAFADNAIETVSLEHTNLNMIGHRAFAGNRIKIVDLPYYLTTMYATSFADNRLLAPINLTKCPFVEIKK